MQLGFKTLLHTQLAHVLSTAVVVVLVRLFDFFLLGLIDAPDVANHVTSQFAVGITSEQAGLDIDAREAEPLRRKLRHFFIGQAGTDG